MTQKCLVLYPPLNSQSTLLHLLNSVRCRREDEKRTQDPALNSNDYDLGRGGNREKMSNAAACAIVLNSLP